MGGAGKGWLCPDWLFGMAPHEHIFGSIEEVKTHLVEVATFPAPPSSKRWFFFDFEKLYNPEVLSRINPVLEAVA